MSPAATDARVIHATLTALRHQAGELADLVLLNMERIDLPGDLGARVLADVGRISRDLDTVALALSSACDPAALQVPPRPRLAYPPPAGRL